jgi:uncharacterized protein (DUF427 family)
MERRVPDGVVPIEPGPGQESVWDYPRPPRVESVAERVRAVVGGRALGDTRHALRVLETAGAPVYYLPPADIDTARLRPSDRTTVCEWKGTASYFDYDDGSRRIPNVAWTYRSPKPGYELIRDHLAFYASRIDEAWIGDEPARPQSGGFYGGWVTEAIVGPMKGDPGSEGW